MAKGPIGYGNSAATWRSGPDASVPNPKLGLEASAPNHMCVYITMCVINIIFSLIIQSVHIKNIIIYVVNIITFIITRSIDIKNIIICVVIILEILNIIIYVINIIIFIIINIINKIINKFETKIIINIIICVIIIFIFIIIKNLDASMPISKWGWTQPRPNPS